MIARRRILQKASPPFIERHLQKPTLVTRKPPSFLLSKIQSSDPNHSFSNWVLDFLSKNRVFSPKIASFGIYRTFCVSATAVADACHIPTLRPDAQEAVETSSNRKLNLSRIRSLQAVAKAQSALKDYLHCTRGLDFTDAEHISKNSKAFLSKLLEQVDCHDNDIAKSVSRFLRYHPVNEFEPFFESIGVKPQLLHLLLPKNLTFLGDDHLLMENYRVLCNYGVPRKRIGKMLIEAAEIFRYGPKELAVKLKAYEDVGLGIYDVASIVSACPRLLVGDADSNLLRLLEELEGIGMNRGWIAENIHAKHTYVWHRISCLLSFIGDLGLSKQKTAMLVRKQPGFLLDGSGKTVFRIVAMLLKLGATRMEISELLSHFPQVRVAKYLKNLHAALSFLIDIHMKLEDIKVVVLSHPGRLGSCALLKPKSVRASLGVGGKKLRDIIKQDPGIFLHYVKGAKIEPLPETKEDDCDSAWKKFLLSLGLVEDQKDMVEALRSVRGKPDELQRKYIYLIEKGFKLDGIVKMIKAVPLVMQQSPESIRSKVDFLIDKFGYPIESIIMHPRCLQCSMEKLELRFLMYNWLLTEGKVKRPLSLTTILRYSEESFVKMLVNRHPEGPEVWDKFRKAVYSC